MWLNVREHTGKPLYTRVLLFEYERTWSIAQPTMHAPSVMSYSDFEANFLLQLAVPNNTIIIGIIFSSSVCPFLRSPMNLCRNKISFTRDDFWFIFVRVPRLRSSERNYCFEIIFFFRIIRISRREIKILLLVFFIASLVSLRFRKFSRVVF